MIKALDRRDFIKRSVTLAGGAAALAHSAAQRVSAANVKTPFKISLAEWSFHKALFGKKMEHLDFARTAKRDYDIGAVEYVNQFFADKARDRGYLAEMKKRAAGEGVESRLIMIDDEGALGDADEAKRKQAVENHYKWVDAAKYLGCFCIRVNAQSGGTYDEQMARAADGLRRLTEYAATQEISVIVENHGGLSSNGAWLAGVMKKVDHPRCGTLPDFGNFNLNDREEYDRYRGVQEMMPYAKAVSAKSGDFDGQGNEVNIDYRRMLKIVADANYHSFLGIEYEGERLSEADGVRATKTLIERVSREMEEKG